MNGFRKLENSLTGDLLEPSVRKRMKKDQQVVYNFTSEPKTILVLQEKRKQAHLAV